LRGTEAVETQDFRVIDNFNRAILHGTAEVAGKPAPLETHIGGLDALHAACADEHVELIAIAGTHNRQVLAALSDELAHEGHGVLVDRKATQGDAVPILDYGRRRLERGQLGTWLWHVSTFRQRR